MFETVRKSDSVPSDCEKCGYPISAELSFCPNCGAPVKGVETVPAALNPSVDHAMKATMRDVSSDMLRSVQSPEPVQEVKKAEPAPQINPMLNKTVRIGAEPYPAVTKKILPETASFRLRPIDVEAQEAFAFGGDTNASFEFDEGQWYIADESGTNSVYVNAARRIALEKGDVVLIGGRRYRFE